MSTSIVIVLAVWLVASLLVCLSACALSGQLSRAEESGERVS